MNSLKLGIEVIGAHDLVAKDGQGSSTTFVELEFDDQKFRTTTKDKDLSPIWNEIFYFNITDPSKLPNLNLDACIYHYNNKSNASKIPLGKVRLTGTSFVPYSDAVVLHYPLEKKGIFSRTKGELGLKVFIIDDPSLRASNPLPAMQEPFVNNVMNSTDESLAQDQIPASFTNQILNNVFKKKNESVHTFHNLPKSNDGKEKKSNVTFGMHEMKSGQSAPKVVKAFAGGASASAMDYGVRETSPSLGGGKVVGGRVLRGSNKPPSSTYDLVEPMEYLFVRVVKARDLPRMDLTGSLDPYVVVRLGNFKGTTKIFEKNQSPEWNEVFAFAKDNQQATTLEVVVKDKDTILDDLVGTVRFDLYDVPRRVPPDSPLAPQWYRIVNKKGEMMNTGEIMLAVWKGTQADEAFSDAWHSDSMSPTGSFPANYTQIRSKVYTSPRLWYLRVKVIEAQDLVSPDDKSRAPDAYVKLQHGNQIFKTKPVQSRVNNPRWDQGTLFVAAEPFEEPLIITVEDKNETIGNVIIPLNTVDKRADDRTIRTRWYPLLKSMSSAMEDGEKKKKEKDKDKFASRIHVSVYLDGGYHVLDESTYYSSDLRPTSRQLWKKPIGVLELGILNADVQPTKSRDGRGISDVYCVAKYGHKWVRTRTVVGNLNPKFNEQYTWEVYDPSTVLTLGVFDNGQLNDSNDSKDSKIGKVRIRLSTLETGRIYTHNYPLLSLQNSGLKKMGEVHLAIRFSCTSMTNMINLYFKPHLPKMHYTKPLNIFEQEKLKYQAMIIVAARLGRTEPPLRKEVVEYMSDSDSHLWSMRKSKANITRLKSVFSGLISVGSWLMEISTWQNSITTVLVHILYMMLVCFPRLILPTMFLYMFIIGMWKWRFRPRYPPHMDTRLSCADVTNPDEFDEEFDPFPTKKSQDIVRWRYDRLRSLAGRVQSVVGDIATQGERLHALLNWRDPRATTIFMLFSLVAALVLYVVPSQLVFLLVGFYLMRHPKLRGKLPPAPVNFFRRLPALTDSML
ncbi:multiple C2 and transmembrane domain-containing protein 2-like [Trifolium pratense]|uniref:Multiple C2 and transmembrane domain-containing protein 2-like n=1 Tax=Trifolium pratense TaxID=57577 RepID=A0A2K3N7Q0_TRIPR|nr:multiple C2 and transmembrane domain-containing protein 2-like [Trifolium pratense]